MPVLFQVFERADALVGAHSESFKSLGLGGHQDKG